MNPCVRAIYRIKAEEEGPARARAIVDRELRSRVSLPVLEELELMVSELVTEGVRSASAGEAITLDIRVDGRVRCAVVSTAPDPPAEATSDRERWPLRLVSGLADRWGVTRAGNGTRVWFETRTD